MFRGFARWLLVVVLIVASCKNKAGEPLPAPDTTIASKSADSVQLPTRSAGCAKATRSDRGEMRTVLGKRTFHVWAPKQASAEPLPVLFTFHGYASNGRDFQKWFSMEDHVNGEALVVYPDSATASWDFTGERDLAFFDAMLADLSEAYCIDPSHVFAFGFSFGGRFTHHLGCHRAQVVRAIAAGGADWSTTEKGACGRIPVLVSHRTSDNRMSYDGGRESVAKWAGINGCSPNDDVTDVQMGCRAYLGCANPVVFCTDSHSDPKWKRDWNHTVREEYRDLTWRWLSNQR